mgnify:CR=1 FL=1
MAPLADKLKAPFQAASRCRGCGSSKLHDALYLGDQPLANSLKAGPLDEELKVPLTLSFCSKSGLAQLKETVRKEILFSHYVWVSGTAAATQAYAKLFVRRVLKTCPIKPEDLLVEIASNDGTFLKAFMGAGLRNVLGVDPASNLAEIANRAGARTLNRFWDKAVAGEIRAASGKARLLIARNVIPHVSELSEVLGGVELALDKEGVGIFEFHYAGDILKGLQYDSIYHEHLCYFSLHSMSKLLEGYGLFPFHVESSPISGGGVVLYFSKRRRPPSKEFLRLKKDEDASEVNTLQAWTEFARKSREHKKKSLALLSSISGKRVLGFGCSARSSTYLNFCGIGADRLGAIIDSNPLKQGRYAPGSSIPIVSLKEGLVLKPDFIFILAWNFKDEVVEQCRSAGFRGRFLVALPNEPKIINPR